MHRFISCCRAAAASLATFCIFGVAATEAVALTVSLAATQPSPRAVGTPVLLTATATGATGIVRYRFEVTRDGVHFSLLADFGKPNTFSWSTLDEGSYALRVSAADEGTGEAAVAAIPFQRTSLVTGPLPVMTPTTHPLVGLVSIPACTNGVMRVRVKASTDTTWQGTTFKRCQPGRSLNFYVGGLRAATQHVAQSEGFISGAFVRSPTVPFTAGTPSGIFADYAVTDPADASTSAADAVLLSGYLGSGTDVRFPIATNLAGDLIWYYDIARNPIDTTITLFRPVPGGTILFGSGRDGVKWQVLREMDLAGNIIHETNVDAINGQLAAMGREPIGAIHHEAVRLPDGSTAFLGSVERVLFDVQGPGPVSVLGDAIIVLDPAWRVSWVWNAFEQLDPSEVAVLGEVCTSGPGCPPVRSPPANDWTHSNSVTHSPADGNLVISVRHLDAVFKVDYRNGAGDGHVVWRLGRGGDFSFDSPDPWPWFSHQHDAHYEGPLFVVYDNGNTRRSELGDSQNSRGMVLLLDETAMIAHVVHQFDLGDYSGAVGSAERLSNGNFHFENGFEADGTAHEALEMAPNGVLSWGFGGPGSVYRSFRMRNMYRP